MLETPSIPHYRGQLIRSVASEAVASHGDNVQGAENQQERLDGYIAGYVDGEGSFSITVNRNSTSKLKFQLVPKFHVSQNGDRREVLDMIKQRLDCGYIKRNGRKDRAMVLSSDDDRTYLQR